MSAEGCYGKNVARLARTRCSGHCALRSMALCFAAIAAALVFPWTVEAAPNMTLSPGEAACSQPNFPVTVRGAGFPVGQALEIYDFDSGTQSRPGIGVRAGTATVGADGAFAVTVGLVNCGPGTPVGTRFTLAAFRQGETGGGLSAALASAVFTVQTFPGLPNTGGGGALHRPWLPNTVLVGAAMLAAAATLRQARDRRRGRRA